MESEVFFKIASVAMTGIGALTLYMIKWLRDDIKEVKFKIDSQDKKFSDMDKRFSDIENRLVAIETGLKMFEWFEFKRSKVEGDK